MLIKLFMILGLFGGFAQASEEDSKTALEKPHGSGLIPFETFPHQLDAVILDYTQEDDQGRSYMALARGLNMINVQFRWPEHMHLRDLTELAFTAQHRVHKTTPLISLSVTFPLTTPDSINLLRQVLTLGTHSLESLRLEGVLSQQTPAVCEGVVTHLGQLTQLKELRLPRNQLVTVSRAVVRGTLVKLRSLETLNLSGNTLDSDFSMALTEPLQTLPGLQQVDVSDNYLNYAGVNACLDAMNARLCPLRADFRDNACGGFALHMLKKKVKAGTIHGIFVDHF